MSINFKARMYRLILNSYRDVFARPEFYSVNQFLIRMGMAGVGVLNHENDKISGEVSFLSNFASKHINPVIIDVGANVGNYSRKARHYSKDAKIYAFEPHPTTFK